MKINCVAIGDDLDSLRHLERLIGKIEDANFLCGETDWITGLEFIRNNSMLVDIVFLDIELQGSSGLDLIEELSKIAVVILIGGYPHYGEQAYEKGASGYLVKPIAEKKFLNSLEKAREIWRIRKAANYVQPLPFYYIPGNGREVRIKLITSNVVYIKGAANFSEIYGADGSKHFTYLSLKQLQNLLPKPHFFRIQKSYIVNIAKIAKYDAQDVYMDDGAILSFGDAYRNDFIQEIKNMGMLY